MLRLHPLEGTPDAPDAASHAPRERRLRLVVPRQDGADQLAGWYLLNVHLQRTLGVPIRVEPADAAHLVDDWRTATGVLVYAHPEAVADGVERAGWLPLVRPAGQFDEALVVSRKGVSAGPARRPLAVACGADHWLLPDLGIEVLAQHGLAEDDWLLHRYETTAQALSALLDGQCELAMMAQADWQQLGSAAQHDFYAVAKSHSASAFPALCLSADLADLREPLLAVFRDLPAQPAAQHIHADLGCTGFEPVPLKAVETMRLRLRLHRHAELSA